MLEYRFMISFYKHYDIMKLCVKETGFSVHFSDSSANFKTTNKDVKQNRKLVHFSAATTHQFPALPTSDGIVDEY